MKNWILALLSASALALLVGCGSPSTDSASTSDSADTKASASAPATPAGGAEPVAYTNAEGKLLCPVMNSVIASKEDAISYQDYEGKRYYFCCGGCPEKFKAEPAKYAKK